VAIFTNGYLANLVYRKAKLAATRVGVEELAAYRDR
jgi:hypothetical protein